MTGTPGGGALAAGGGCIEYRLASPRADWARVSGALGMPSKAGGRLTVARGVEARAGFWAPG
jgi:hypothetical protein